MTQHPNGVELVRQLLNAYAHVCAGGNTLAEYEKLDELYREARNAIIALIDDPVRAAGPELLEAAKRALNCIDYTEIGFSAALEDSAGLLRAAIAKAEAPAATSAEVP